MRLEQLILRLAAALIVTVFVNGGVVAAFEHVAARADGGHAVAAAASRLA